MQRIESQETDHTRIARKALAWVSYALRPLSLKKLQHALAVEPGDKILDEELMMDGQSITQLCADLVIVDQRTNVVNLIHYSTKSYFDDIRHVQFPEFHANITLICATYLTLNTLNDAKIWEMVQNFPLACYAAQYLSDHARQSPEEALNPSILNVICHLLSHPDKRKPLLALLNALDLIRSGFYSTGSAESARPLTDTEDLKADSAEHELPALLGTAIEVAEHYTSSISSNDSATTASSDGTLTDTREEEPRETKIRSSRIPEVTALHLAASMGLAKIASLLLKETSNIDAVDETGKTALGLTLERGFEKAVELLVDSGACVDLRHDHDQGILLLVTERDWYVAANSIATRACRILKEETSGIEQQRLSVLLAAHDGDVEKLHQMIGEGDLDLSTQFRKVGETSLFLAVEQQNLIMVQSLLDLGVDVNAKDNSGQCALHRATHRRNVPLVKFLLENNALVDCNDDDGRTPWSANVRLQDHPILEILRHAGADPSTKGMQGVSELYAAAKDGETDLVRFMLDSGTDPSIQTDFQWAPLHWAASHGHTECVSLLIQAGADVSVISDQRVTPLDLAIQADQHSAIALLTRAGAKDYRSIHVVPQTERVIQQQDEESGCVSVPTSEALEHLKIKDEDSPKRDGIATEHTKLRLVYDQRLSRTLKNNVAVGQFVFMAGTYGPSENIYHVSHVLEGAYELYECSTLPDPSRNVGLSIRNRYFR